MSQKKMSVRELFEFCRTNAKPASVQEEREMDLYVDARWPRLRLKMVDRAAGTEEVYFSVKSFAELCDEKSLEELAKKKQAEYRDPVSGAARLAEDFAGGRWEAARPEAKRKRPSLDDLDL